METPSSGMRQWRWGERLKLASHLSTDHTHNLEMSSFLPLDTPKALGMLNSHLGAESYINGCVPVILADF